MSSIQNDCSAQHRQAGLSLIELMIAITLGLLLTGGMIQLFNSSRVTFQTNDALARVQENGRFSIELLKRDLRSAGTHGFCAGRIEIQNHLNQSCMGGGADFFDPDRSLTGWEYDGTGSGEDFTVPEELDPTSTILSDWSSSATSGSSLPSLLQDLVVPGSDVIVTRRLDVIPGLTADPGPPPNNENQASIKLAGPHGLPDDAIVLITNCASGVDLFQNTNNGNASSLAAGNSSCTGPGPGNQNGVDWATSYDDSMQAFTVTIVAYYIGLNPNTQEPGLYRLDMSNGVSTAAQELVQGAENMQILYGYSRAAPAGDGQSVNEWLRADQVPADGWQQVIAIRLGLGIRSPETADGDRTDMTFNLSGTNVTATGDGRLRQPFSTTIALRNRLIVI